ncbi:hypothetical protein MLD38_020591 [Melastoma candidum]|uniref:Uncharacterized protein n=1 Tax=Melastoma candidum TaxID=119954 RepID=A0ACB9QDH7_9MYRT|nr:hypothetical protein MLD38_020591 [Melastoma candidum]
MILMLPPPMVVSSIASASSVHDELGRNRAGDLHPVYVSVNYADLSNTFLHSLEGAERTESEIGLAKAPLLLLEKTDWYWKAFIPDKDRDHWAINMSRPNTIDRSSGRVPGHGGGKRGWQKRYHKWVKRCGKEVELVDYCAWHSFYMYPRPPESRQLRMEFKRFKNAKQLKFDANIYLPDAGLNGSRLFQFKDATASN